MKVMHLLHSFPPQGVGGTEHYVLRVAAQQLARGDEAAALYPLVLPHGVRCRVIEDSLDLAEWVPGLVRNTKKLTVLKVTNPNRSTLYWTAFNREVEEKILEEVASFEPDVVHVHHLYWLSARVLRQIKERFPDVRLVVTFHDYWYACYKGTLRRPWGELCSGPSGLKCMGCIEEHGLVPKTLRLAGASRKAGGFAAFPIRYLSNAFDVNHIERPHAAPDGTVRRQLANAWFFLNREKEMIDALSHADEMVAPSRYVATWYQDWLAKRGQDREIKVVPNPLPHNIQKKKGPKKGKPFTIGFAGQLAPHKGVDHLLRAFRAASIWWMQDEVTSPKPVLRIYGPSPLPAYRKELQGIANLADPLLIDKINFEGRFEPAKLPEILDGLDLLIIPSRWQENAPLVALEAMAVGVPILAPRLGGLPQLITADGPKEDAGMHGLAGAEHGWLYGHRGRLPADSELADALVEIVSHAHKREIKPASSPSVKEHVALLDGIYRTSP